MKQNSLDGRTILITGATFGIGEALVRHLMRSDVQLILVARTEEKLLSLQEESKGFAAKVVIFPCDLSDENGIAELCERLKSFHIDHFISNAGKSIMRSLHESQIRDHKKTMAVNYLAPVQIIYSLKQTFSESKTHIVNISSYNVLMRTPPKWGAYVSSKKAMHSWFEGNVPELALLNITVSNVYLPLVESRMKDANEKYKNTRAMSMDRAVNIIVKCILNRRHFRPWWNAPFQIFLFLVRPAWNNFWIRRIRQGRY